MCAQLATGTQCYYYYYYYYCCYYYYYYYYYYNPNHYYNPNPNPTTSQGTLLCRTIVLMAGVGILTTSMISVNTVP